MPEDKPETEEQKAEETQLTVTPIMESADSDVVSLIEEASISEGEFPIKIIQPGWGRSGYYSESVLREAAQEGKFDGRHMHWDHRGQSERPERSLHNLAGVVKPGSVKYQAGGSKGAGVYGTAFVFPQYRSALESMRDHIGVSIVGNGKTAYESHDGRSGASFKQLDIEDVDFVTKAGAGGAVVSQFNSYRGLTLGKESKEPEMPETKTEESAAPTQDIGAVVKSAVESAMSASDEKWEKRIAALEESHRNERSMMQARQIVSESALPQQAKDRVIGSLSFDESSDPEKLARDAVEAELRYIESITPVSLRRQTFAEEASDDKSYEQALAEAESVIFGEPLEADKE